MDNNHNHKTDSKTKKCNSCRLELPIHCFGQLRSAPDGCNYACRDCRNYRRRAAYNGQGEIQAISPLREHNYFILSELLKVKTSFSLSGLQQNKRFLVSLTAKGSSFILTVHEVGEGNTVDYYFKSTNKSDFLVMTIELLFRSEIRLLINKK